MTATGKEYSIRDTKSVELRYLGPGLFRRVRISHEKFSCEGDEGCEVKFLIAFVMLTLLMDLE